MNTKWKIDYNYLWLESFCYNSTTHNKIKKDKKNKNNEILIKNILEYTKNIFSSDDLLTKKEKHNHVLSEDDMDKFSHILIKHNSKTFKDLEQLIEMNNDNCKYYQFNISGLKRIICLIQTEIDINQTIIYPICFDLYHLIIHSRLNNNEHKSSCLNSNKAGYCEWNLENRRDNIISFLKGEEELKNETK